MKHDARLAVPRLARPHRRMAKLAWALVLALSVAALVYSAPARAVVLGSYPSTPKAWKVYGKAVQIGASLMSSPVDYRFNSELKPSSFAKIPIAQKLPQDAVVVGAFLFWGGSTLDSGLDNTAQFTVSDGVQVAVTADKCDSLTDPSPSGVGTHFYCRKDVTSLIGAHPGSDTFNGTYTVGDVNAKVASVHLSGQGPQPNVCLPKPGMGQNAPPDSVCCDSDDGNCQARHASWSLILVYDTKFSETTLRDIFLYDGFLLLDERWGNGSGTFPLGTLGQKQFTISNFLVGDPPDAILSYHAMEGDKQLGNPEQDPDPGNPDQSKNPDSPPCSTCYDFVQFNGTKLTGGAENADANNIMNSTPPGGSNPGLDLDVFDISGLLKPGDTSATFLVSSGNGTLADNDDAVAAAGGGELFFFGATLLQINRKAPNFKNPVNKYYANATEASPGDVITYTVDLLNTGPVDAEATVLKLDQFAPAGTDYVPGSTTVDGKPLADVGGQSALAGGLALGSLTNPAGGNQSRTVTFKVKVKAVPGVSEINSFGIVAYQYIGGKYSDAINTKTSVVKIVAATLGTPLLTVNPNKLAPAGTVTWSLTLQNTTALPQVVDSVVLDMPPEVKFFSATGPGQNNSTPSGGANGTGQAVFKAVPIAANQQLVLTIVGTLKDTATLQAMGISPLNGHVVAVQGTVTLGQKTLKTDDPGQPGLDNTTPFTVQVLSDFTTSSKTMVDLSPATPLLPGDQVQFMITLKNTGPGDGVVNVTDPMPGGLSFVASQSPELTLNGTTLVAPGVKVAPGATKTLVFTAQIDPATAPGATFANVATLSPTDGNPPTLVQTPQATVQGGPELTTSTKTASDVNGGALEPGDTIQYVLTLSNTGKVATGALQVNDPLDTSLEGVAAIDGGGVFDGASNSVMWSLPAIAPGAVVKLSFSAKVKAGVANGTTVANLATVNGSELAKPVQLAANLKVQAQPVISLFNDTVTSSGGATFKPGDTVTYTLTLQNTGNGVVNLATLSSSYDAVLQLQSASGGGVIAGQNVTWNLGTLKKGDAPVTVTVTGKLAALIAQDKSVSSQGQLTGDGLGQPALSDDPGAPGQADPTVFKVTSAPDLSTSLKSFLDINGGSVQGGDQVQFSISVKNTGNAPATQIVVTDLLAGALSNVVVAGGSFEAASKTVTWNAIPLLNPGETLADLVLTATVDKATASGATVTNQGKLVFTEKPGGATTNTVQFQVQNLADFGLSTKAVSAQVVQAGGNVTYTLTIVNSGNATGTGIVVTDAVPKELTAVQVVGGTFDAGTAIATWQVGTMAAGEQKILSLSGTLSKPLDKGLQVCNQAQIKSVENPIASLTSPPGTAPKPGGTPTCLDIDSAAKLVLTKDVFNAATGTQINQSAVKPKTALRYVIKAKNTGNAAAKGVIITDVVPAELTDIVPLDGATFDAASKTITWPTLAALGVNPTDELVVRFEAKVGPALDNGQAISNQALMIYQGLPTPAKSDDPTTAALLDPTVLTAQSNVDFSKATLTVVDSNGGAVQPGDAVVYTLVLKNDGDGNGKLVTVTLPIDPRLEAVSVDGGGVVQGGVATWQVGSLAPGQGATFTIQAKVKKPQLDGAIILAQGLIKAQGFAAPVLTDADLGTSVKEPAQLQVKATADLATSVWTYTDLNGGTVEPGDAIAFALTLKNTGDALAQALQIKALLQQKTLTGILAFDGGVLTGDQIAWTVPLLSISPAGDVTIHFQAQIAADLGDGTKVTVVAQIPGVVQQPQLTLTVDAKPKFNTSLLTADDETGWVAQIGQVAVGHVVRIELKVQNSGKTQADAVTVTVPLPAKLGNVQVVTPGGTVAGGTVTFSVAQLAAGGSTLVVFKATVAAGAQDGDTLPLLANITANGLPAPTQIKGTTLLVVQKPILKLTKAFEDLTGKHLFPGDSLRFVITATNVGNAAATDLAISDVVPVGITDVKAESGGTATGQVANWQIASLLPAQTVTVTLTGKVAPGVNSGAVVVNQAKAKPANGPQVLSNSLQVPVSYPTLLVQVALTPEAPASAPVHPGDTVQMQIVVASANAEVASNVTVIAPVDTALFDVIAPGGGIWDPTAKLLKWTAKENNALTSIPAGGAVALTVGLKVKATAKNGAIALAKVLAREGETQLPYESNTAQIGIVAVPVLVVKKTVTDLSAKQPAGNKVAPLDVLRWRIELSVQGGAAAQDVVVTDALDTALDLVAPGNGGTASAGTLTWNGASTPELKLIAPGTTVVLTFDTRVKATVADGTAIANQAQVLAAGLTDKQGSDDPSVPGDADPTVVRVRTASVLEASYKTGKDDNGGILLPGDTITWRIAVVATSPEPVNNVRLLDTVPTGTDYVAGSTTLNGAAVVDLPGGQCPLTQGLLVAGPGQAAGTVAPGAVEAAVVTFRSRVRADVQDGTLVRNLATANADGAPPTSIGPVEIVVGKGASLRQTLKSAQIVDDNGNGQADIGEQIAYAITVKNSGHGPAQAVALDDDVPQGAKYVGGSLQVDAKSLTDAQDGDAGRYDAQAKRVHVELGTLQAGEQRLVTLRVQITAGPLVANQAIVHAKGMTDEPSDADGDDGNGNQPTVVQVGAPKPLLAVVKTVQDENGGDVRPGDWLRYTLVVHNQGGATASSVVLTDVLPKGLEMPPVVGAGNPTDVLAPSTAQVSFAAGTKDQPGAMTVSGLQMLAGESATVSIRVRLRQALAEGAVVCNGAHVDGEGSNGADAKLACVTIGAMVGEGTILGTLFEDVGVQDGAYQPGTDLTFPHFQVAVLPPEGADSPVQSAIAGDDGAWRLPQVAAGAHRIVVSSPNGAVFYRGAFTSNAQGGRADVALQPTGRVYDAHSGRLAAGVRVYLRYDDADPILPGQLVPADALPTGQQGQRTDATGAYVFQPTKGRSYRLDVSSLPSGYAFPPAARKPESGLAVLDQQGFVVADALPRLGAELPRYLTRFTLQGTIAAPPPRHNHLPVDALTDVIRVAVRLSKTQAQQGEIVHVTVNLQNGSSAALVADPVTGVGGVELRNAVPAGLGFVPGSARLIAVAPGAQPMQVQLDQTQLPLAVRRMSATTGKSVGLDLPAGGALTLTMQAVVLGKAVPGSTQTLGVQAFEVGGMALTRLETAYLVVQVDPLFNRSMVLAKVFCDANGDGMQQAGEDGLAGARVFVDSGYYATADVHGRMHFIDLTPGNHLFKLDGDTLPPGSTLSTPSKVVLYLTPGLGQTLTYGVRCALEAVGPTRTEAAPRTEQNPLLPDGPGVVLIEADATKQSLAIDGRPLAARFVKTRLMLPAEAKALAADPTSVALVAGGELALAVESSGGFVRHAVEIRVLGEAGHMGGVLFEQLGSGDVPRTLTISGLGRGALAVLQPDRHYVVRVRAETAYGTSAWSAPLPFEVRAKVSSPRQRSWLLVRRPAQFRLNGHAVELPATATAAVRIVRPADGRLLAFLRAPDGAVREEFMTLARLAGNEAIAPPQPGQLPAVAAKPLAPVPAPVALPPSAVTPPPAVIPPPTRAPSPAVVPVPAPVPIPLPVPVPVPVPRPAVVPVPVLSLPAARVAVPVALLPGGALQIAAATWTPTVKPLLVGAPAAPLPLANGQVLGRVLLHATGMPAEAQSAAIVLLDADGRTRWRTEMGVPLPRTFYWEPGALVAGQAALTAGRYGLALEALVADKSAEGALIGWRSVPVAVELAERGPGLVPAGDPDRVVRATLFDPSNQPTDSMQEWLDKTAGVVKADSGRIAVITVHDNAAGDAQARSAQAADHVKKRLLAAGVRADRLLVFGLGNTVADFKPHLDKMGPHRVEVRLRPLEMGSAAGEAKAFPVAEGLWIDGERVAARLDAAPATAQVRSGKPTSVAHQRANGQAALWQRVFTTRPPGVSALPAPQGKGPDVMDFGADVLDAVAAETKAAEARLQGLPPVKLAGEATVAQASDSAAADLQVLLPKAGAELASLQLPVRGHTRPGNKVTIQGQDVPVDSEGNFYALVPLAAGKNTVAVVATDAAGNKAMVERPLTVKDRQFFLMAIADSSISHVAAHLSEVDQPGGYLVPDSNVQLFGRAAVYAKGRISGQYLGLKDLQFTAHLDTAKDADLQDFATNLLDPTRFYPVYGDAGSTVQDARSRGMLYVLVEADKTKLLLGNMKVAVHGIELVRYDRSLYGAQVDVRRTFGKDFDTRAQVFVAGQDSQLRRHTDMLRGTGGSLYYLSSRDVIDGSERVQIVIRDRISNLELARVPQTRNLDYTIEPREGRVLFKSPVSGAVDAGFSMGQMGLPGQHLTWNGQPVFVEVVYEARGVQTQDGTAVGVQVQEKVLGGKLALGASYVQEGRSDGPTYRVVGGDATVQVAKNSKLTAEYAFSQSRDTLLAVSDDGGLSFGTPKAATEKLASGAAVQGHALKFAADVDLRDFFGKNVGVDLPAAATTDKSALDKLAPQAATAKEIGRLHAHYQWVQAGFQSGGTIAQQGQQKAGLDTSFVIGERNRLQVRYDGLFGEGQADPYAGQGLAAQWGTGSTATSGSLSQWNRHTFTVQDVYRASARWSLVGGNTYGQGSAQDGKTVHSDTLLAGGLYRVTDRFTVRGDQQVILAGDPAQFRNTADHFATTVGLDYKLAKALSVTVQERIGWGGQNATLAGLRTELDANSSIYVQQRLEDTYQTGRVATATVIGAESRYGDDKSMRAFGEYQIDALNSGGMNRAIMGVGKRFVLSKGVTLDAGYERQQTFGGATGETARDALSLGGEWLRSDWLKVTSRQEVRLDTGDRNLGGVRKVQFLSLNNAQAGITTEMTLFGRANWTITQNQTADATEAEALETTLGAAFRPIQHNWFNAVGKYTHLIEQRPSGLDGAGNERSTKDILSLEPMAELPWRLSLAQKVAWRRAVESMDGGLSTTSDLWLLVTRLGWHVLPQVDLAAEYRFLETVLTGDLRHGALAEAAWLFKQAMRLGVGYNFSHFVETPVGDIQQTTDRGGFFLRLTGMY